MSTDKLILVIAEAHTNMGDFSRHKPEGYLGASDLADFGDNVKIIVSSDFSSAVRAFNYFKPALTLIDPDIEYTGNPADYPADCGGQPGTALVSLVPQFGKVAYYTRTGRSENIHGGVDVVDAVIPQASYVSEKDAVLALLA